MGKGNSLPHTKGKLFELTRKILSEKKDGHGVTSVEVVSALLNEIDEIPNSERHEIIRHGLMVLAGRVTTMNGADPKQADIFQREGLPIFVDLRIEESPGRFRTERFDVRNLTPNKIVRHTPSPLRNKGRSRRDNLIIWAQKQIAVGFGDVPVEKA